MRNAKLRTGGFLINHQASRQARAELPSAPTEEGPRRAECNRLQDFKGDWLNPPVNILFLFDVSWLAWLS
jgi:hypothetical protein